MNNCSPAIMRVATVSLLAALMLVQGFLLEHELEHALSGGEESCHVCYLAGKHGDALPVTSINVAPQTYGMAQQEHLYHCTNLLEFHFSARAPPRQTAT